VIQNQFVFISFSSDQKHRWLDTLNISIRGKLRELSMPFKKGESGNPGGRTRAEKHFAEALRLAVMRAQRDKVGSAADC
jgi:hypothetical protein